jgi:hypothetical protein
MVRAICGGEVRVLPVEPLHDAAGGVVGSDARVVVGYREGKHRSPAEE